jgi:hypothetical protein
MWDGIVFILLCNVNWWINFEYIAFSGFPFTFLLLYFFWILGLFPLSMYTTYEVSVVQLFEMLFLIDVFQTCIHYAAHTWLRHTMIGTSHMIHHVNRNPKPQDAFFTGLVDSFVQLILPIMLVVHIVQPSRYTAILFGSIYSWWLLFIHSNPMKEYKWLESFSIVTPNYHHKHHTNPRINFSNIISLSFLLTLR